MNRSQLVTAIVWLDQLMAEAKAERDKLGAGLDEAAQQEYRESGTVPTWRIPDIATVSGTVSKQTVVVADPEAFRDWVVARYPEGAEIVTTVRPGWQLRFLDLAEVHDGDVVDAATGEVVPGLGVREGGRFLGVSVRATGDAKRVLALAAGQGLKHAAALAGPNVPIVLAELEAPPPKEADGG